MRLVFLVVVLALLSFSAYAQEVASQVEIKPAFEFIKQLIGFIVSTFPKAGPIVQAVVEIIGAVASFFTLASVFVISVLKIPYLLARWAKAHELADSIQKLSDKISPYFKYLSIFNVQKK